MRLRDLGLRTKDLVIAAQQAGVPMTKQRASEIINGQAVIRPREMEVIAGLLNKTVDEVYQDIGSLYIGIGSPYECEYWDWELHWRIKDLNSRHRSMKQCANLIRSKKVILKKESL